MEGDLVMGDCDRGDTREIKTQLLDGNGQDKLPLLIGTQVSRISQNGLVLKGNEMALRVPGSIKAKVSPYPQTWWVLIHTGDLSDILDGSDFLDETSAFGAMR